jgi:hypothetical protein
MKRLLLFACVCASTGLIAQSTFTDESSSLGMEIFSSHSIGVVDLNGDGLDDIVGLDDGNDLVIWFQEENGDLTLWEYGAIGDDGGWDGDWSWGLCAADLDHNGMCDLVAGGSYDGLKVCSMNDMGDDFTIVDAPGSEIFLQGINFFDIDYDGFVDIFACHDDGPSKILLNDGDGALIYDTDALEGLFETAINGGGEDDSGNYGSVWTDVNGDRYADCYIAKCRQGVTDSSDPRRINQLWIYDPVTGSYNEEAEARGLAIGAQSWSADFADYDNDGDMDAYVGNHDLPSQVMRNDGGMFTDVTEEVGLSASSFPFAVIQSIWRDFDNDGWIDLLVTGGGNHTMVWNNGDGTFNTASDITSYELNSFALGDLNDDGFVDIYSVAGGYGAWGDDIADGLQMNDGNDNHWIKIDLEGVESNKDAIGAIVEITGSFGTQIREVRSGESYGIMNSMILHFGIGEAESVDDITIYWPSGLIDQVSDPEIDGTVDIIEGANPIGISENTSASVQVFPNPSNGVVNFYIDEADINDATLTIIDLSGRTVLSERINASRTTLNLDNLSAGIYNWSLQTSNGIGTGQVVIEK